jgi:hypothetical protein
VADKIDYVFAGPGIRLIGSQQSSVPTVAPAARGTDGHVSDHDLLMVATEFD